MLFYLPCLQNFTINYFSVFMFASLDVIGHPSYILFEKKCRILRFGLVFDVQICFRFSNLQKYIFFINASKL